jgi:hypothetical protein
MMWLVMWLVVVGVVWVVVVAVLAAFECHPPKQSGYLGTW